MKKLVAVATAAVLMSGCASVLTDDTTSINIGTSTGEEVTVAIDGQEYTVPGIVSLKKSNADKTIVSKDNRCAKQTVLKKEIETEFWINLVSGGPLGSTTDMATEKMWTYADSVEINCKK
ncbi:adenosine deaminase [Pelagibaculum spongiae]|uniref:Adenosine deaminase n=1 Tax=Pelagibaculum spongiae TaxID=2080658 RepID=A0A2V1GWX2_9GAMM|nr:adenosine deaminase [Pelagibaculum spongiae]